MLKYGNITQSLYLLRQVYDDIESAALFGADGEIYAGNNIMEDSLREDFDPGLHEALEDAHGRTLSLGCALCRP